MENYKDGFSLVLFYHLTVHCGEILQKKWMSSYAEKIAGIYAHVKLFPGNLEKSVENKVGFPYFFPAANRDFHCQIIYTRIQNTSVLTFIIAVLDIPTCPIVWDK